jgi:hypothetical protein
VTGSERLLGSSMILASDERRMVQNHARGASKCRFCLVATEGPTEAHVNNKQMYSSRARSVSIEARATTSGGSR